MSAWMDVINAYLGTPYVWGGNTENGVDCSGFTRAVFEAMGVDLPRVSFQQANAGQQVSADDARPGDLVWWDLNGRNPGADHVGVYLGNGKVAEASSSRGQVVIRNLWGNARFARFGQGAPAGETMGTIRAQTAGQEPQEQIDTSRRDQNAIGTLDTRGAFGNLAGGLDPGSLQKLQEIYAKADDDDPGETPDTVGPYNVARLSIDRPVREPDPAFAVPNIPTIPAPPRPMVRPTADASRFG